MPRYRNPYSILIKLFIFSMCIPATVSIYILDVTALRAFLMLVFFPVIYIFIVSPAYRFHACDACVVLFSFWVFLTVGIHHPNQLMTFGAINVVEINSAYFVARVAIRNEQDLRHLAFFLVFVLVLMLPILLTQSLTGRSFLNELLDRLPYVSSYQLIPGIRLGLQRTPGVFVHSIHMGLFAALVMGLFAGAAAYTVSVVKRVGAYSVILTSIALPLSSGPLLAFLCEILLFAYHSVTKRIRSRWRLLLGTLFVFYTVLEIASSRLAIFVILEKLVFNTWNANFRKILLEEGLKQIQKTPIFGYGYKTDFLPAWMTSSIDNFWLQISITNGLPSFVFILSAFIIALSSNPYKHERPSKADHTLMLGWKFTLTAAILTLATVTIWGPALSFVFFFLGAGAFYIGRQSARAPRRARPAAPDGMVPLEPAPLPQPAGATVRREAASSDSPGPVRPRTWP